MDSLLRLPSACCCEQRRLLVRSVSMKAPFNFSAKLSTVLIIISIATLLQILWVILSTFASSHIHSFGKHCGDPAGCCVPLLAAGCVLFTWYISELVDLVVLPNSIHILHLSSLSFFISKYAHTWLHFDHLFVVFFSSSWHGCLYCYGAIWCRHGGLLYTLARH